MSRPSLLRAEMSLQAPRASRQRASTLSTLLGRLVSIWGFQSAGTGTTSRTSLSADGSHKSESKDEIRASIALIRGFKLPPDVTVTAGSSTISVLTPSGFSSIWGSLSSAPISTARTSISLPGGGSDSLVTARTLLSMPAEGPVESSIRAGFSAATTISSFLWPVSGSPELRPSLPQGKPGEIQDATIPSTSRSSSTSTAQLGVMPSAVSSRSSVSMLARTRGKSDVRGSFFAASSSRNSLEAVSGPELHPSISNSYTGAAVKQERSASSTRANVSWWRRITSIGRSNRISTSRRLSRKSKKAGSRSSSPWSGSVSPIVATNGVEQWLSRAGEGPQWASHSESPRASGSESASKGSR